MIKIMLFGKDDSSYCCLFYYHIFFKLFGFDSDNIITRPHSHRPVTFPPRLGPRRGSPESGSGWGQCVCYRLVESDCYNCVFPPAIRCLCLCLAHARVWPLLVPAPCPAVLSFCIFCRRFMRRLWEALEAALEGDGNVFCFTDAILISERILCGYMDR